MPLVPPPTRIPFVLRPALWIAQRLTGKDPLPARLLAYAPKAAFGAGVLEMTAAHGPADLDGRLLAIARIVASARAGCPFCLDMNAATHAREDVALTRAELDALVACEPSEWKSWPTRDRAAALYALALSSTPVVLEPELRVMLASAFTPREIVVLASTIAQVNFWARFNQGLDVPAAGFFDDSVCVVAPARAT